MIQSMTGFAEKNFSSETFSVKINIRSLNSRFLDISFKGTPLGQVEERLRNVCQQKLSRGKIESVVELTFLDPQMWKLNINQVLLKKIFFSVGDLFSQMGKNINIFLDRVLTLPQVMEIKRKDFTDKEIAFIEKCFKTTLESLLQTRKREGEEIEKALKENVRNINSRVERIQELSSKQPHLIHKELKERLKKLTSEAPISEEKLAEEAAFLAQRYDLREEIVRLKAHLNHFQELLSSTHEVPLGKKLNFLSQEMYRETNTLSAKAQEFEITRECLDIKGEIESIREQVQNVE